MKIKQTCFCLAITANLAPLSHAVYAKDSMLFEEIVVTAQKRAQSLQEVPVAVTAISGEMIESQGIDRIEDLGRISPSLSVNYGMSNTQSGLSIRGIGNNLVFSAQVEPAVLVIWDDVSLVQAGQAFSTMVDVERVEVIRGPQNTLFGKNASAGVINIVSRAPSEEFEGRVELTSTNDDQLSGSTTISGPLGDSVRYRLTGFHSDRDGYVKNVEGGKDLNERQSSMVRGSLVWSASDALDITLNANYSDSKDTCCSVVPMYWDENAAFLLPYPLSIRYSDMVPGVGMNKQNMTTARDDVDHQDTDNKGVSIKADWRLGEFDLTSITAYNEWQNRARNDIDFSARDVPGDLLGYFSVRTLGDSTRESDFFSQELRLASPLGEQLDYLLGAYYSRVENSQRYLRYSEFAPLRSDTYIKANTETYALYGQGNWHFTEDTSLTVGLRLNYEEVDATGDNFLLGARNSGKDDDVAWVGKISLQHQLTEATMVYAGVSSGYKGQAYDTADFNADKAKNPVKPEKSVNYEAGIKSTLLDGKLRLNGAVFLTNYDNFQAQDIRVTESGSTENRLLNVGELQTRGVEVEGTYTFTDNFHVSLAATYIDAEVKKWDNAPCYPLQTIEQGCDTILSVEPSGKINYAQASAAGNQLPSVPEWKYTLNANYRRPLETLPFDIFVNTNYLWQDKVYYDIKGSPLASQDSYGVANISVGLIESTSDRYQVTAFVNNVFDKYYTGWVSDGFSGTLVSGKMMAHIPLPSERYAGIRVQYNW